MLIHKRPPYGEVLQSMGGDTRPSTFFKHTVCFSMATGLHPKELEIGASDEFQD